MLALTMTHGFPKLYCLCITVDLVTHSHGLKLHKHNRIIVATLGSATAAATPGIVQTTLPTQGGCRDPLDTPTRLAILIIWY